MRKSPRRRIAIGRVESLEPRNLMVASIPIQPPVIIEPLPVVATPAAPPTVAFVQFEPLTGRILVSFTGDPSGYNIAALTNPANYSLTPVTTKQPLPNPDPSRPNVDVILAPEFRVTGVTLATPVAAGQPQSLIVSIDNNQPIKFGTYQFTINSSGITDLAGNVLDGSYSGVFPSGNGQPGSNFVANLIETHSTILPARPVTAPLSPPTTNEVAPTYVYLPSTRQFRVRYLAAKPAKFQLAGGNKIRLQALPHQFFPGTYRAPTPIVPIIDPPARR